ncbi:hypothetical protein HDV06_000417 [Boothiomyces sp. JEL0866]|nr:hypothetical protein HDV06_000417 [Boothiomyces sp. JEL0866]
MKKHEIMEKYHINKSHELNKKIGELWANEPPHVKEYYQQLSLQEHENFKKKYPDFDWQPWKSKAKVPAIKSARLSLRKNEQKQPLPQIQSPTKLDIKSILESNSLAQEESKMAIAHSSPTALSTIIRTPTLFPKISEDVYEATKLEDVFDFSQMVGLGLFEPPGISYSENYGNQMFDEISDFNLSPFLQYAVTSSPMSKKEEICKKYKIKKSHEVSSKAAELWANEPQEVREYFQHISLQEHDKFKILHPHFDWQPWIDKSRKTKYKIVHSPVVSPEYSTNTIAGSIVPPGVSLDVFEASSLSNNNSSIYPPSTTHSRLVEDGLDYLLSPSTSSESDSSINKLYD